MQTSAHLPENPSRAAPLLSGEVIYLDNNATTRPDPEVLQTMWPWLGEYYGNPSSNYRFGYQCGQALAEAREKVAALVGGQAERVIFTSCGSESVNTALACAMEVYPQRRRIVVSAVEHNTVLAHARRLGNRGREVVTIPVDSEWRRLLTCPFVLCH